jgi:hypothetical protein
MESAGSDIRVPFRPAVGIATLGEDGVVALQGTDLLTALGKARRLGMEILQERERNPAARFCPIVMRKSPINAHTHNLGVTGLELVQYGLQAGNLSGSSRCPIQGIKHQHHILLPLELAQSELGTAQMACQLKIRGLFADFDQDDFFPPY